MKKIERHTILRPFLVKEYLEESVEAIPKIQKALLENPAHAVGATLARGSEGFLYAACADVAADEVIRHLRIYKSIALSNFRFGNGKEAFSEDFDGKIIHFTPQRKSSFMSVDHWEEAYDACMILRDMEGLRFLVTVEENVFSESNNGTTPHDLSYYRFMAHFFGSGKDTGKLLIAAFEEAMKPQQNPTRTNFVELVRIPILELIQAFVESDNAKFNDMLVKALEAHKKYFGTKENAMAVPGWISLRILAACAMAVDAKGFSIEVESEYIPRWLYMGEGIK